MKGERGPGGSKKLSGRVLVLDDSAELGRAVADALRAGGCVVESCTHPDDAAVKLRSFAPDVLVTDVRMPGRDGFAMLQLALQGDPRVSVVLMTGFASVPDAVRAMHCGAEHYIAKPFAPHEIVAVVERALARQKARASVRGGGAAPGDETVAAGPVGGLVAASDVMRELLARVESVAATKSTVLILGETGVGKSRVAEAIHMASPRAQGPFVTVHCGAVPETLLESELFGHERGAFTGAVARREGRFKMADGGTIFLDEIGDVSPAVQVKLLRVLQERRFERVGGNETLPVDVRVVAATNRNLEAMVQEGRFRADLYYRLNVVTLEVPPLRARKDDVPPLVEQVLARLCTESGRPVPEVSREAMEVLSRYEWPGNVRELENALESALVAARGGAILPEHVLPSLRGRRALTADGLAIPGATFAEIERHAILSTYEACGHNALRTAQILGIAERTVHYRLKEYSGLEGRRRVRFVRDKQQRG